MATERLINHQDAVDIKNSIDNLKTALEDVTGIQGPPGTLESNSLPFTLGNVAGQQVKFTEGGNIEADGSLDVWEPSLAFATNGDNTKVTLSDDSYVGFQISGGRMDIVLCGTATVVESWNFYPNGDNPGMGAYVGWIMAFYAGSSGLSKYSGNIFTSTDFRRSGIITYAKCDVFEFKKAGESNFRLLPNMSAFFYVDNPGDYSTIIIGLSQDDATETINFEIGDQFYINVRTSLIVTNPQNNLVKQINAAAKSANK